MVVSLQFSLLWRGSRTVRTWRAVLGSRTIHPVVESWPGHIFLFIRWLKNLETAHQSLIHAHHCARVIKFTAIVWCRKKGYQLAFAKEFVAIFNYLVSAANQINVVAVGKLRYDVLAKGKRNTTVILSPVSHIFVRIGPEKIAE